MVRSWAESSNVATARLRTLSDRARALAGAGTATLLAATGLVALVARFPYIVGPVDARQAPDSGIYVGIAHDLVSGRGFHTASELRTPGYPLLLVALKLLPGSMTWSAIVFQHLLGIALTMLVVWTTDRYFGRAAALIALVIGATSPVLVNVESDLLPDFLVGVLALAGAVVLIEALAGDRPRLRLVAVAGVVFGAAALVKPVGQVLLLAALVPLLAEPRGWRRGVAAGAVLAACLLLTITPWLVRNAVRYGDVRMSVQDGPALWLREFDWDRRPLPTATKEERFAKRLYEQTLPRDDGLHPSNTYEYVLAELETHHGYSERSATALQRRVALAAIRAAPGAYLRGTISNMRQMAQPQIDEYWGNLGLTQKTQNAKPRLSDRVSTALFSLNRHLVAQWRRLALFLLAMFALPFTRLRGRRAAAATFLVTWLGLIGAAAATTFPDPRYASPAEPFIWVLGSAAIVLVVRAVVGAALTARRAFR